MGAGKSCYVCRISIHALLAESDCCSSKIISSSIVISIHALLAESDNSKCRCPPAYTHFYPRSPCGERPPKSYLLQSLQLISIHALLAESDPCQISGIIQIIRFLSTLSLRRATLVQIIMSGYARDFYPRSPCGERLILPRF